jgi:hypothetical protein
MAYYKCPNCENRTVYSIEYDAEYCPKCNEWLEEKCDDSRCQFCYRRPVKPNEEEV